MTATAFPLSSPERSVLEAEVIDIARQLSPDELRVFKFMGRRMIDIGHKKYGPLDLTADDRDWIVEIAEERADGLFYEQCRDIAKAQRRREREQCEASDKVMAAMMEGFGIRGEGQP